MEKYRLVEEKKGLVSNLSEGTSFFVEPDGSIAAVVENLEGGQTEVKITQQGKPRNYISYAINLFVSEVSTISLMTNKQIFTCCFLYFSYFLLQEKGASEITLKAMGRAINKAVTIAEILKRKLPLHQVTTLTSSEIIDVFEPLEEGLDIVESKRNVSCMTIALSKTGAGMDFNHIGYQPPLSNEEIQPGDSNVQPTESQVENTLRA